MASQHKQSSKEGLTKGEVDSKIRQFEKSSYLRNDIKEWATGVIKNSRVLAIGLLDDAGKLD